MIQMHAPVLGQRNNGMFILDGCFENATIEKLRCSFRVSASALMEAVVIIDTVPFQGTWDWNPWTTCGIKHDFTFQMLSMSYMREAINIAASRGIVKSLHNVFALGKAAKSFIPWAFGGWHPSYGLASTKVTANQHAIDHNNGVYSLMLA